MVTIITSNISMSDSVIDTLKLEENSSGMMLVAIESSVYYAWGSSHAELCQKYTIISVD